MRFADNPGPLSFGCHVGLRVMSVSWTVEEAWDTRGAERAMTMKLDPMDVQGNICRVSARLMQINNEYPSSDVRKS